MSKILIVEDNNDINNLIAAALNKNGYTCVQAFSGTEAEIRIESGSYSLIILDLMLPGMSGDVLLRKIKKSYNTPVIILSAKDELDTKVNMLTLGAEDYITKPFEIKELLARVAVQLRRSQPAQNENEILKYKDIVLDTEHYLVTVSNNQISLTRQEFKILELFLSFPDKVFSKQGIYEYAWDDYYIGEDKTINVHISNIRKKLKEFSEEEYIETVWGIGFKLAK